MAVQNPPPGFEGVTPYLIVKDAEDAIGWYERALDADLKMKIQWNGKIGHAELAIGGANFMLAEEMPDLDYFGPKSRGGTTVSLLVYVPDVDMAFKHAIKEGAHQMQPIDNKPWGDRSGQFVDPFGHRWTLATHVEDVSNAEITRRLSVPPKDC